MMPFACFVAGWVVGAPFWFLWGRDTRARR